MKPGIAFALLQAAGRHAARSGSSAALRHLGGFGLFLVAILDSSPLPTFGGLDVLTAIFAARHQEPWYYYAIVSTTGSLVGATITYRIARRAGRAALHRKFGERHVTHLLRFVDRWGAGTLVVSTLLPPPMPTTVAFAAAGALSYPIKRFLVAIAVGRAVRYSLIAGAASRYGRHFVRVVRHPERYVGWSALLAVLVIVLIAASITMWWWGRRRGAAEEHTLHRA